MSRVQRWTIGLSRKVSHKILKWVEKNKFQLSQKVSWKTFKWVEFQNLKSLPGLHLLKNTTKISLNLTKLQWLHNWRMTSNQTLRCFRTQETNRESENIYSSECRNSKHHTGYRTVPSRWYRRRQACEYRQDLTYLSMVICIFISFPLSVVLKCQRHFVVKFWLSGSFRVRSWG